MISEGAPAGAPFCEDDRSSSSAEHEMTAEPLLSDRGEGQIRVGQTGQHEAKRIKILLLVHAVQDLGGTHFSGAGSRYGSFAKCGIFLCHTGQMGGVCLSGFRMKKADSSRQIIDTDVVVPSPAFS